MIKRTIEISREPAHLAVRYDQLLLQRGGATVSSIPCEDLGMVVVDHQQTTYTHAALSSLMESDAVVVICGRDHLPLGLLIPLADHTQVVWRIQDQVAVSKPVQKQLWKQIVQAKILAQAKNLAEDSPPRRKLEVLAKEVKSGDTANHEAQAARIYWSAWLVNVDDEASRSVVRRSMPAKKSSCLHSSPPSSGERPGEGVSFQNAPLTLTLSPEDGGRGDKALNRQDHEMEAAIEMRFRRDTDGEGINSLLNYGYTIVRAAVARALVSAGLHPALGLHHSNRGNPFCLADDLMEPLRPLVDARVRELHWAGQSELDQPTKARLLELLTQEVETDGESGPLMVSLHRFIASLVKCYGGTCHRLEIPVSCNSADIAACGS